MPDEADILARIAALEALVPDNAYRRKAKDGHHHNEPVEGMDDAVSQGFGYQLNAIGGLTLTRAAWPNNRRLDLKGGGMMNVDYVVDPAGGGSHTTLTSAVAAAIAAGGDKTIWICSSPAAEDAIDLGGIASNDNITIASHSRYTVVVTAKANDDIFKQDSDGGQSAGGLHFWNIGLNIPTADYAIYFVNTENQIANLTFDQCDFVLGTAGGGAQKGYLARQVGNDFGLDAMGMRIANCTGVAQGFFDMTGSAGLAPTLGFIALNNRLELTQFWDGGANLGAPPETVIDGGEYILRGGIEFATQRNNQHFRNLYIVFHPTGPIFKTGGASTGIENHSYTNIAVEFKHTGGEFGDFGSGGTNDTLFFDSLFGWAGVDVSAGTFLTVDPGYTNVQVGNIHAPDFGTLYSGPGSEIGVPMIVAPTFEVEGNADGLGNRMVVIDGTGVQWVAQEFQRSGTEKAAFGLWDASSPTTFGANDFYFAVNDGSWHDVAAFKNDGSALILAVPLDMSNNVINNLADPVLGGDAVNLDTLLDSISIAFHYHFLASNVMSSVFSAGEAFEDELITGTPQELTTIFQVSTAADTPTPATVGAGTLISVHFDAAVLSVTGRKPVFVYVQLGYVDADGSSNFVQIGADSDPTTVALTEAKEEVELHIHVAAETNIPAGKRLKVKWWATTTGAQQNPTVHIYYGALNDHITIPISASILGNYLPLAGGTMTGAIAMGTNKVTGLAAPSGAGDALRETATATEANLDTLTDTSDADALHDHGTHGVTHNAVHGVSKHTEHANWKVLYTDASGDETELALGADGTFLQANGAAAAPTFAALVQGDIAGHGAAEHTEHGNWKVVYTDGSGDETELALGADGTFLQANGAAAAPTFAALVQTDIAGHGIAQHTEHANWKLVYTDGSGDEQELTLGADDTILESTGASSAPVMRPHEHSMGITIENPGSSEDLTIKRTDAAITVKEIHAVLRGSDTPSVTWTIRHQPAGTGDGRGAAGNEVVTGGTTTTSITAGDDVTVFDDATIPADSFVWLETTAKSGTVNELHATIRSTFD